MNTIRTTETIRIRIWGIVQGVGFRPFIAKLADRLGIPGEVRNIGGLVEIAATADPARIDAFLAAIRAEKPLPAEIVHIKVEAMRHRSFAGFTIVHSVAGEDEVPMLPADLAICPDCLREMREKGNPRHLHPFISCMACGPRYSIIDRVPYDRENTAMVDFSMCEFCQSEYSDRKDRRYHAQTISCHDCGPVLLCRVRETEPGKEDVDVGKIEKQALEPLQLATRLLDRGDIIALKGVGGYYFVCSPFQEAAVQALRRLKIREEKPFAVMFRDIAAIKAYCVVSEAEEKLLLSNAKPIVLLARRPNVAAPIHAEVYKTSRFIGAFLPGMGLQYLLADHCGPLIMTSANMSERPIIKDDQEMFALWEEKADPIFSGVFYNERQIRIRLDDSVARIIDGQPQMIRRSKGYAPTPLYIANTLVEKDAIFAAGAQLKSAFSLSRGSFAYASQYFGDLDGRDNFAVYEENLERMEALFHIRPQLAVSDLHPLYETTKFAERYAAARGIASIKVQHHHAHIASVMAEHDVKGRILGVGFDGTGYGNDGTIWGGEFLLCEGVDFDRIAHLEPIEMLGGDGSMKEGWKSALCYGHRYLEGLPRHLEEDPRWPLVKAGLENRINTIASSSMGRLFDAVAAFCGIHDTNRYEGECAIQLENWAARALQAGLKPLKMEFACKGEKVSPGPVFTAMAEALAAGVDPAALALGFHDAVAEMILAVAEKVREEKRVRQVALTGGVFQNKILMEKTLALLRKAGFDVYYNVSVAPNDNGICLGQNYIGMAYLMSN